MILTDELADRIHAIHLQALRQTELGYLTVRPDTSGQAVGAGYALFAGDGSPLTQAFGFGYRQADDPVELDRFFAAKCENWEVTVTPFTHPECLQALHTAGYRPDHFEGCLAQTIGDVQPSKEHRIVEVGAQDPTWMEVTWRAWTGEEKEPFEPDELVRAVSATPNVRRYLAFADGQPAAAASAVPFPEGVMLGGAATRVPFRGRGLQEALLLKRLADAGQGQFALMGALPGSSSHRNAQRVGFQPIFSSLVMMRR